MITVPFEYVRPASLQEALEAMARHGDDAKILAGGHSLIPAMKLRLAQPSVLVDLGGLRDLRYIREQGDTVAIGAMTTHRDIEASELLANRCPLLPAMARRIGDAQVRNKGTLGGSLVHADPAADWPAGILALDTELEVAGPDGRRTLRAREFFVDMLQTAVGPQEILCEIRVPVTARSVAYVKFPQKASGFAIAGVAAAIDGKQRRVRVGITGVAPVAYRAAAVEEALNGQKLKDADIVAAAGRAADGVEPLGDMHASAEFRAHLARVGTERALREALGRS